MKPELKKIKTLAYNEPSLLSNNLSLFNSDSLLTINIKHSPSLKCKRLPNSSKTHLGKTMCYGENSLSINKLLSNLLLQNTTLHNVNININYTNISPSPEPPHRKKSPNELWTKTRNIQKMVNAFLHPSVEKINDKEIFKSTLRSTLLGISNEKFQRKLNLLNSTSPNTNTCINDINISYEEFIRKTEVEREFIRVHLKEKAYEIITEMYTDPHELVMKLGNLFQQNPEKNKYTTYDERFLFNQPLSNGKNILYIACQDNNYYAVKYLLSKQLNPNIRLMYYGMEDTCLWVACRWGYYNIVKVLLNTGYIDINDVYEQIERGDCNKVIITLLKKYVKFYKEKDKKDNRSNMCKCF